MASWSRGYLPRRVDPEGLRTRPPSSRQVRLHCARPCCQHRQPAVLDPAALAPEPAHAASADLDCGLADDITIGRIMATDVATHAPDEAGVADAAAVPVGDNKAAAVEAAPVVAAPLVARHAVLEHALLPLHRCESGTGLSGYFRVLARYPVLFLSGTFPTRYFFYPVPRPGTETRHYSRQAWFGATRSFF